MIKIHCNCKNQRQRENLESSKGKEAHHIQGNLHNVISRYHRRNVAGQERVVYVQNTETKKKKANQEVTQQSSPSQLKVR